MIGEKEKQNCLAKMRRSKYNSQEIIEKANNYFDNIVEDLLCLPFTGCNK